MRAAVALSAMALAILAGAPAVRAESDRAGARPGGPKTDLVDIREAEDPVPVDRGFHASGLFGIGPNVRINNPAGDGPTESQSETAVAAFGLKVIAGWNDSKGFTTGTISSYGYSLDGGLTWTDGGDLPLQGLGVGEQLYGDPGLCANRQGNFWFCSLYFQPGAISAIGVNRGNFLGAVPSWQTPVAVAPTVPDFQDKCAIACDPDSNYVYLVWTRFLNGQGEGRMEFARSLDGGVTWTTQVLQPLIAGDNVEAGYIVVDEAGGVNVFWEDGLGRPVGTGQHSYLLHRRSVDQGASFGPVDTAAVVHQNPYCGPPGFNRRDGFFEFANAACDRSAGPNRGTLYLAWNESCEPVLSGVPPAVHDEVEPNNSVAQADSLALPVRVSGRVTPGGDLDYYKFYGTAGQMVRVTVTAVTDTLYPEMRLSDSPGADTTLIDSRNGQGLPAYGWTTLPSTGIYDIFVDARYPTNGGYYTMDVELVTAAPGSVGRDHREAVVAVSRDHGAHWSAPVLVNDAPPYFDECMPFVAVDTLGYAHAFWYDRRNDPLRGGRCDLYYARSADGGLSWSPNVRITDQATTWQVPSHAAPNFGDYSNARADGNHVYAIFADGRYGNPDAFTSPVRSGFTVTPPADTTVAHGDTLVRVYTVTNLAPFPERFVYDFADSLGFLAAAHDSVALAAQGAATLTFRRTVPDTLHYSGADPVTLTGRYRSSAFAALATRSAVTVAGRPVGVAGEAPLVTGLGVPQPSPARGPVLVSFSLATRAEASLEVYDIAGRRLSRLASGELPAGAHRVTWSARTAAGNPYPSGVYFVRAGLAGQVFTRRIVLLR